MNDSEHETDEADAEMEQSSDQPRPLASGQLIVTDIFGLGKAAESLNPAGKAIANAFRHVYRPIDQYFTVRSEGTALRHEATADVKTYLELQSELAADPAAIDLVKSRLLRTELRRQTNIDKAAALAVEIAESGADKDPVKQIDQDFMADWIEGVKDVSHDEVRKMWAKILAAAPKSESGRISKPSIELLKQFDHVVARNFERYVAHVVYGGHPSSRYLTDGESTPLSINHQVLEDLGVIESRSSVGPTMFGAWKITQSGQLVGSSLGLAALSTISVWAFRHRALELANAIFSDLPRSDDHLGYEILKSNLESLAEDVHQHLRIMIKLKDGKASKVLELSHPHNAFHKIRKSDAAFGDFCADIKAMIAEIRHDCVDFPNYAYSVLTDFALSGRLRIAQREETDQKM